MSDLLHATLNMPSEYWGESELDKLHRHSRYVQASELIEQQQAKIKELERAQPKWISVDDELPEKTNSKSGMLVLVCFYGNVSFAYFYKGKFLEDHLGFELAGVTHWMPLPQKPEVK